EKEYLIPHNILKHISQIDEALANLKVADPSVGSGAFPLGMLNEIVKVRMNITEYLCKDKSMVAAEQIRFARSSYLLKKETIKNCLFAVDIESSAVEITKLRLWLSLIVDENENGIRALPNLDYNIMCGNSLINEFEGIKLFDESLLTGHQRVLKNKQLELFSDRTDDILEQLYMLQQRLFDEQNASKKKEIKNEAVRMEWELIRYTLERENKPEALKKLEKYKKDKSKPYFLWKLEFSNIFKEKSGFDIVIGNPPYGAELDDASKKVIRKNVVDTQNLNSAAVFIDYTKNQWIHAKGIVSFIVPKSLLYSEKWYSLVESLLEKTSVLVDVEKAFDKVKLEQIVFTYNHSLQIKEYLARKFIDKQFIQDTIIDTALVHKFKAWICDVSQEELDLVKSIQAETIFLKEISITKRGMGLQKFLSDQGDYPVVGGKNIFRYGCEGIKGYLPQKLVNNQASKLSFMQNPKIISQDLVAHVQNPEPHILITSYYDESGTIISMDTVQNTILHDLNYSYKYIVALLNSTFVSWYTYKFIYCTAIRTMHFDNNYIGKIIIPRISLEQQQTIVQMVDELSGLTSRSGYKTDKESKEAASMIMKELDQAIYRLYGLTDAQIRLVIKSNK
ncbi:MAG: hypothetical protein JWM44_538, partial [Bacilli bacterium]|nr:hypothetical protein [Bacilli bacterium]